MSKDYKYQRRGVSATKDEVHAAIQHLDKGLYPNAFCKILPDVLSGSPEHCLIMHADTAGTKTSLAYMYWRETGDLSVWDGIAQDAIVMNLDDMACVGCVDNIVLSSTIGRNKNLIPGEVLQRIIQATSDFAEQMRAHGVRIHLAGGETADVGDIVRSIDVGYTAFARMRREDLIVNDIQPGDLIVGLASYGQASYENSYNGGMGSNGLSSARHDVFAKAYAEKYPECYDPATPAELVFSGSRRLEDPIETPAGPIAAGKLVLSPTRTYLPVLQMALAELRPHLHGIIHNTGGGQAKVLKFVKNRRIVKTRTLPVPPLFELIQRESGTPWAEMYQVFNMGQRLEFYVPEAVAPRLLDIAAHFGIEAAVLGHVEAAEGESVEVHSPHGIFKYGAK